MSIVRKYKALGEMVPRSKVGGGEFVRLEDYEALQAECDTLLAASPVPPAGGEVEVLAWRVNNGAKTNGAAGS